MLSAETANRLRAMSVSDRLRMTLRMTDESLPFLLRGTPEQVHKRFELLRRQNDERNHRTLQVLARSRSSS